MNGKPLPTCRRLTDEEPGAELQRARQRIADLEAGRDSFNSCRIDSFARHLDDGVSLLSPEGVLLDVNPAFEAMFGYSHAELVGVGLPHPYWPPEEREHLEHSLRGHLEGQNLTIETTFMRKDGERLPVLLTAAVIRGETDEPMCIFATIRDISEFKRALRALEHSAALLNQGESLAHLRSWEWDIASGVHTVSAEWRRIHGLSGEALSPETVMLTCHEDDCEAMQAALQRAGAGEPYRRLNHRIVRPDTGEVRHLMTYGEPLFDAEGNLETVIGASLDVTERVHADEVLRERGQRLRRALRQTVATLGATVAMRDPYTADHERRVSELVGPIAERLGWGAEALEQLRMAALVHDLGKIAVPAEILAKPGRLTEIELALVRSHPQAAYETLAPIEFSGNLAEVVLQHHERLDGSGYPRGLRGEEILPGARILAVADVVEAMISHRPYRPALPLAEAMAEIGPQSRGRFDAEVAEICRRLFAEGFTLPE